jgi:hypothetical protein
MKGSQRIVAVGDAGLNAEPKFIVLSASSSARQGRTRRGKPKSRNSIIRRWRSLPVWRRLIGILKKSSRERNNLP